MTNRNAKKKSSSKSASTSSKKRAAGKKDVRRKAKEPVKSAGHKARKRSIRKAAPTQGMDVAQSPTFMGHRVITIDFGGEKVEVVEGRHAYRPKMPDRLNVTNAADLFKAEVAHSSELDQMGMGILQLAPGEVIDHETQLDSDSSILWHEPVVIHHGCFTPNDVMFPIQWGLRSINAERAWDLWNGDSRTVILAILDTGVPLEAGRLSHPDLDNPMRIVLGPDLVNRDSDPADDHGHGTHITGIATANVNNGGGIAGLWPGPVLVIKVSDAFNRSSDENFRNGVIQAVNFARQRDTHLVINYSSVGPNTVKNREAVEFARANGALIVAPTGNNFGSVGFPAAYSTMLDNVIAVGAVDPSLRRPPFSNRGPQVTVVAPGVGILSTMPNYFVTMNSTPVNGRMIQTKYDQLDGTSQATPLVSALAALVWSKQPQLTAQQVRDKIIQTATRLAGPQIDFGFGLINAERALT